MAKKITARTKLKVGDLISYQTTEGVVIYQVAKIERKKGMSPCLALNKSPGDKEFKRENGVDWYTRIHQSDLVRHQQAEVISVIELVMHFEHSKTISRDQKIRIANMTRVNLVPR